MAIGGKEFVMDVDDFYPCLRLDLIICSPDLNTTERHKIKRVLIDTGSDFTFLPIDVIKKLNLIKTGTTKKIEGFYGKKLIVMFYSGRIIIEDVLDELVEIGGIDSEPLIGMDLINKLHILINAPNCTFEIANRNNYKPPNGWDVR